MQVALDDHVWAAGVATEVVAVPVADHEDLAGTAQEVVLGFSFPP